MFPFLILLSFKFDGLVALMCADVTQPPKDPDKSLAISKDIGISYRCFIFTVIQSVSSTYQLERDRWQHLENFDDSSLEEFNTAYR